MFDMIMHELDDRGTNPSGSLWMTSSGSKVQSCHHDKVGEKTNMENSGGSTRTKRNLCT